MSGARRIAAAAALMALMALIGLGAPARAEGIVVGAGRAEDEAATVLRAAEVGGPAGLAKSLEDCWFSSAGYGSAALAPCAIREQAALILVDLIERRIGALSDPALTEQAARDRLETAYESRGAPAPGASQAVDALLRYALERRIEPGWDSAPRLTEIEERLSETRRRVEREGPAALQRAVIACWTRLALSRPDDPAEAVAAAWSCRVDELLADLTDPAASETPPPARRRAYFEQIVGAGAQADAAVVAAAAALAAPR